jgi:alpha-galactosidase
MRLPDESINIPRPGGQPPKPMLTATSSVQFGEMINANEGNQFLFIDRYLEERFPIDCWWMDAGWYENNGRWQEPLALRVNRKRFPRGLRAITDHARARGLKSIVWFEPERIMPSNELFRTYPDWLLPNIISKRSSRLFFLGNPEARAWLTDTVSRLLTEEGIDIYRQDFCILEPAEIWRSHDAADRKGITENHHITGYLAFWDELLRRHPGLIIDCCAGGGLRNDLESMRRALPFFRSDHVFDVVSNQSQSYGLSLWIPFFGTATGQNQFSAYELRSNLTSPLVIPTWDMRDRKLPYDDLRREINAWRDYAQNYSGDFYPLTPPGVSPDAWIGWQLHRPEAGRGVVQAFRRDQSVYESARLKLRGLEAAARYRFTDLDHPAESREFSGAELMQIGLAVAIVTQPGAAVITYEKVASARQ